GCIDQIGYRQAFPARDRLRHHCKTLPEFLEHVARERPVLGVSSQAKLGVARLDQHTHEAPICGLNGAGSALGSPNGLCAAVRSDSTATVADAIITAPTTPAMRGPRMSFASSFSSGLTPHHANRPSRRRSSCAATCIPSRSGS